MRLAAVVLRAALLLSALLACSAFSEPEPGALVGRWVTAPEPLSPVGSAQGSLTFDEGGRFAQEWRMYGVYPGQGAGDLSSFTRTVGTFRTEGGRLRLAADTVVSWDRFYGADSPPTVQPLPLPSVVPPPDDMRFEVGVGRLTLHYDSYPADAPVPTTQRYERAP